MSCLICTSIEQSKKLLELGLKPETADMYWDFQIAGYILIADELGYYKNDSEIPAWSLSALLELMPPYLFEWKNGIDFQLYPAVTTKRWQCGYISEDLRPDNPDKFKEIKFGDTPVNAAYEMIVWLLENKKI